MSQVSERSGSTALAWCTRTCQTINGSLAPAHRLTFSPLTIQGARHVPIATPPPATPGTAPTTSWSTAFRSREMPSSSSGWCWRSTRPGCRGSRSSRSAQAFRRAYDGFDPDIVARYGASERRRLLADAGIIRNRLKVEAAIANAKRILELRELARRIRRLARCASSAAQGGVGRAVQADLPLHRRRDRGGVPDEHRVPAGRAPAQLSGLRADRGSVSAVDEQSENAETQRTQRKDMK